jgi:hypothetical protein
MQVERVYLNERGRGRRKKRGKGKKRKERGSGIWTGPDSLRCAAAILDIHVVT